MKNQIVMCQKMIPLVLPDVLDDIFKIIDISVRNEPQVFCQTGDGEIYGRHGYFSIGCAKTLFSLKVVRVDHPLEQPHTSRQAEVVHKFVQLLLHVDVVAAREAGVGDPGLGVPVHLVDGLAQTFLRCKSCSGKSGIF